MAGVYKTAQGKLINMDNMRLANETTLAVGNTPVNARGDEVRHDGTVIKTKQEAIKERNHQLKELAEHHQKRKPRG